MAISAAARTQLRPQTVTGARYGDFTGRAEAVPEAPVGGKGRRREIWVRHQKQDRNPPREPNRGLDLRRSRPDDRTAPPPPPDVGNVADIADALARINNAMGAVNAEMAERAQRFAEMQKTIAKKRRLMDDEAAILVLMDF